MLLMHTNYDTAPDPPVSNIGSGSNTRRVSNTGALSESKTSSDTKAAPRTKASFLVDNENEETASARKKKVLRLSIDSFVVIFLPITLYFLTKRNKKDHFTTGPFKKAHSPATTTSTPPVKVPAQTPASTTGKPDATSTETQPSSPPKN